MKRFFTMAVITLAATILLTACGEREKGADRETPEKARIESTATTAADVKKEAGDLAETTMTYTEEQIAGYKEKIMDKVADLQKKQEEVAEEMAQLNEAVKANMAAEMEELKIKKAQMDAKLLELQAVSSEAFGRFKQGMDKALEDMEKSYNDTLENLKKE